ncbi:tyrosine-type recombinase/integrase [Nocardia nova]|uniref:tyrosine-type recombinase/integrase n=1 Tax=Nocardia nova TaxID=37330 RepID=UPI00189345DA|nr:tyrosine-type recombinase/integrase [Nocardia nova]MBF6150271.1 tyrosine-type recombinase/integrase [Nocardia nova]
MRLQLFSQDEHGEDELLNPATITTSQDYVDRTAATGSDNTLSAIPLDVDSGSDNTPRRGRGRSARQLSAPQERILTDYADALERAPLSAISRSTYVSQVRGFLSWIEQSDSPCSTLLSSLHLDGTVRDYRTYLQTVLRRKPATINLALAAIGDFCVRTGLGAPKAARLDLPPTAPRSLSEAENTRWLRAVERRQTRDRVLAYLGRYAGLRISERVNLNLVDVQLSARKGLITVWGKGGKFREIPTHPLLHQELSTWIYDERPAWPGAADTDALLLNYRGDRLGTRGADKILDEIAEQASVSEDYSSHVDRHSFATELLRDRGVDIVLVAELLGHARLEETRRYTLPSAEAKAAAVAGLAVDQ